MHSKRTMIFIVALDLVFLTILNNLSFCVCIYSTQAVLSKATSNGFVTLLGQMKVPAQFSISYAMNFQLQGVCEAKLGSN